jgi:hypothetical protein
LVNAKTAPRTAVAVLAPEAPARQVDRDELFVTTPCRQDLRSRRRGPAGASVAPVGEATAMSMQMGTVAMGGRLRDDLASGGPGERRRYARRAPVRSGEWMPGSRVGPAFAAGRATFTGMWDRG